MEVGELIRSPHPFLEGLCEEHLRILSSLAMHVRLTAGEPVFREGEMANRFYLIQRGKVSLESRAGGGPPIRVQLLGPGEALGWSWLFPPYLWHFDAWAVEDADAIFFHATQLREECEADRAFGYELMKRVSELLIHRLQATRMKMISERNSAPLSEIPAGE